MASNAAKAGELEGEIAAAYSEQALGIEQVNIAVTEMEKVTRQNAANAEESATASGELNAQAEEMKAFVNELTVMVGCASATSPTPSRTISRPGIAGHTGCKQKNALAVVNKHAKGKALALYRSKEVHPKDIIPIAKTPRLFSFWACKS